MRQVGIQKNTEFVTVSRWPGSGLQLGLLQGDFSNANDIKVAEHNFRALYC